VISTASGFLSRLALEVDNEEDAWRRAKGANARQARQASKEN
jgi:hypothetical protein